MNIQKPLEILIFGTGAVGSTLGWRLAQNPYARLSVVCRSNYDAVRLEGIQMRTKIWGNGTFVPYRVVQSTREVSGVDFDYVVCANKATTSDRLALINELSPVISKKTALVSVQNGVGVEAPLRDAFQKNTVLSAVCYISCLQPVPGIVEQVSHIRPHAFHIGTYDTPEYRSSTLDKYRLKDFVALDDKFKQIDNVQAERWTKQVFNGAWNPMTAITGLETHQLLASPHLQLVRQLATETFQVAIQMGIPLPSDLPDRTIELARINPSIAPSMLQDARKKKLMEIDSLCGNIIRQAEQVRVPVPTVKMVYHMLLEINKHNVPHAQPVQTGPQFTIPAPYQNLLSRMMAI
ncbi:2-dehydropantoate 2-reductase-like protein [Paraphoma chrysanthemicola]|uniref:2-dehydropantoate 2-reductase n=1 Tax=Paraphoma chrysanthemicola TaxID=798071 RepID=A0A8K0VY60_9PLEO|nr:2-dehydropantoate 2-reductase-like protein [Paraphoma chrysanthemicola]